MKTFLRLLAAVLIVCASTTAAQAATACFDWSCNPSTGYCSFDASCSSASPSIWKYTFDFGDGSGTGLSGSPTHNHQYATGVYDSDVTLHIFYFSDPGENTVECTIFTRTFPVSPQPPFSGRCTE